MQKFIAKISLVSTSIGLLFTGLYASAQATQINPGSYPVVNPVQNYNTVGQLLAATTRFAQVVAGIIVVVSVFMILWAGFKFITAGDDAEQVGTARKYITWGIIGLVVALLAFSVPAIVSNLLVNQGAQ